MEKFFKVKTVNEVYDLIKKFEPLGDESVPLTKAGGRVLAANVAALEDLPEFNRSTMDGYAVRARDTFGASEGLPGLFEVQGEVLMGQVPEFEIRPGQAARIWTGGMLPRGADAVVMVEYARQVDDRLVELARPVAPLENVIQKGEDIRQGQVLLPAGRKLRPQDIGLLAALGQSEIRVSRRPVAAVVSTGDEVVPIEQNPKPGCIRDVNTYSLSALVEEAGGLAFPMGLVGDDPARLEQAVYRGLEKADLVLISGGSSVGVRDYTLKVIESIPGSDILVHGVSVSPGKPTILARIGNKSVWGLPGHTVSALITADLFIRAQIRTLLAQTEEPGWGRSIQAVLSRNVASVHGREDYIRVWVEQNGAGWVAHPILGASGLISTMVKADGLIRIGLNEEGRLKGSAVEILLFQ